MSMSGSCYCGNCRWEVNGEPNWVGTCHCESCRRNCSAPFTTFFGINNPCWKWTGCTPKALATSAGVTRYFCPDCGSPMAYHNVKWDDETHFYVASLDYPAELVPQFHVHWQEKLPWITLSDDLPKYATSTDDATE